MKIIGLSGPSGAGKSTLCSRFEQMNIPCINTDDIYHSLTASPSDCLDELKSKFGDVVINSDGSLDRPALAKLVFEGEDAKENLDALNKITHKYVWHEVNTLLVKYRDKKKIAAVIDAPALFSSQIFVSACDFIISVIADKESRLERIVQRDRIPEELALARIDAQPSDSFFIENSEYYITNSGCPDDMNKQLNEILEQEGIYAVCEEKFSKPL